MRGEEEAVGEVGLFGELGVLEGFAVEVGEEFDEFLPRILDAAGVGAGGEGFGLEGDFAHEAAIGPVEVEEAVETADFLAGAEGSVESEAAEEGFVHGEFDGFAGFEFFLYGFAIIAEVEGVEDGGFIGDGFGGFAAGDGVGLVEPLEVIGVELGDFEGEDAAIGAADGDVACIAFEELALDGACAVCAFPIAWGGVDGEGEGEEREDEGDAAHGKGVRDVGRNPDLRGMVWTNWNLWDFGKKNPGRGRCLCRDLRGLNRGSDQ